MLPVKDMARARRFSEAAIAELKTRGAVFDDYDLPAFKMVERVCVLGSERAARFRDPERNILCPHEDLD